MIQEIGRAAHRARGGKVILVTSIWQKNHQPAPMDADDRLLMQALHERGCAVRGVAWNDPHLSWQPLVEAGSVIVVRVLPTHAYEREALLTWAEEVATQTLVRTTPLVLRWNMQKHFLLDLARRGVPILPGIWARKGSSPNLASLFQEQGWASAVVKPVLANPTESPLLVDQPTAEQVRLQIEQWSQRHELLIQPWLPAVVGEGEHSLVFIAGQFTHAWRKKAALVPDPYEEALLHPTAEEIQLAEKVITIAASCVGLPSATAFSCACVNLVCGLDEQWGVMDVELAKPRLHLAWSEEATACLADALARDAREQSRLAD